MIKNKLILTLLIFLVLIPLRLPVSILFIYFFEWILALTTHEVIPKNILATNIIVSKLVYNIALSVWFLINIELFSRQFFGRKAKSEGKDDSVYWYVVVMGIMLIVFIIIDAISINEIFFAN